MNVYELDRAVEKASPASGGTGDDLLIALAQGGQAWAFAELCKRHSTRVYHMIFRVTRNYEDAEDALQDCTLRAFRKIGQFDGRSSFATWFTRIGINSALMILRKQRIRQETSMDTFEAGSDVSLVVHHMPNPEQHCVAQERSLRLKRAMNELPDNLRAAIELRQMEGHSLKEIARTLGISIPAAKSRLSRAKAELRKSLL